MLVFSTSSTFVIISFFHITVYVILQPLLWHGGLLCRLACNRFVRSPEFTFQSFVRSRDYGNGFVVVCVKRLFFGFDYFDTVLAQYRHKLVVDKLHTFFYGSYIGGGFHVFQGAFKVVHDRKNAADALFSTIQDKFGFFLSLYVYGSCRTRRRDADTCLSGLQSLHWPFPIPERVSLLQSGQPLLFQLFPRRSRLGRLALFNSFFVDVFFFFRVHIVMLVILIKWFCFHCCQGFKLIWYGFDSKNFAKLTAFAKNAAKVILLCQIDSEIFHK